MSRTWSNWAGNVTCRPVAIVPCTTEAEVANAVRNAAGRVRVAGAGHSFTPVVATDETLLAIDGLAGLIGADADAREVEVWAGTRLKALGELLAGLGLAQENLGDIDVQTVAGALSTGTHGTGAGFGGLASQVVGLTLVDATGERRTLDAASDPEGFAAARVSLGALGVLTRVKLRCVPAFRLLAEKRKLSLDACLAQLDGLVADHRRFEFFWLPYADQVQAKTLDETTLPPEGQGFAKAFNDVVLENGALGLLQELTRAWPATTPAVAQVMGMALGASREVEASHRVFATPRLVKFVEMEYALPAEALRDVLAEMRAAFARERFPVAFPIEVRFGAADDAWLAPSFGRATAYVAVHCYQGVPHEAYFAAMEAIFARHGGRPHWGKLHTLGAAELAARYPRWADFQAQRRRFDPAGKFVSPALARLWGEP